MNYTVQYNINVNSQPALSAIANFQLAVNKLSACTKQFDKIRSEMMATDKAMRKMLKNVPKMDISTSSTKTKLNEVIRKLETIHKLASKTVALGVAGGGGSGKGGQKEPKQRIAPTPVARQNMFPRNIGYRNLGPTMIDSRGVGAFDFVKGMGMAYGIAGIGSMMGGVIRDSTEYDNLMQTAKNILKTHDKQPGFDRRFQEMAQIVRNVGIETKFSTPQVADAARFLAMAGFDIEGINKTIRPISDIALVGDTDLGTTADVVTNIMTGYGIAPEKVGKAADVMTMTFTKSNTTLMEIAESYKYASALLSAAGVDFESATAAIGILGDAGIKGSQAGTSMRTIVSNLVNPTKRQLKQWEILGIERFEEDGKLRPILDIFNELNAAGVNVDMYYKMFHRTAAQGAVSLTDHVEKWNELLLKNFMSDGLAHRLAEEKKNTIQGLWYQLTSSFTEAGMKAFESMDRPIKELMNKMIGWLQSPETVVMIKKFSRDIFSLVELFIDFSKVLIWVYQNFQGVIKSWIVLQLYVTPFLAIFRAGRSVWNLVGGMIALKNSIFGVGAAMAAVNAVDGEKPVKVPLLSRVPWGGVAAGLGVAALVGFGIAAIDAVKSFNEIESHFEKIHEKIYATKGYLSEGITPTERYLKLVYDKQLSANQKVEEYIRLRKIEMGLMSESADKFGKETLGETYWETFGVMKNATKWGNLSAKSVWESQQGFINSLPEHERKRYALKAIKNETARSGSYTTYDITRDGVHIDPKEFTRDAFLSMVGIEHPVVKEIFEEFNTDIRKASPDDLSKVYDRLNQKLTLLENQVNPKYGDYSLEQISKLSGNEALKHPAVFKAASDYLFTNLHPGFNNENSWQIGEYKRIGELYKEQGHLTEEQRFSLLRASGVEVGAMTKTMEEFRTLLGADSKTGEIIGLPGEKVYQAAQRIYSVYGDGIVNAMDKVHKDLSKELQDILNDKTFVKAHGLTKLGKDNESEGAERVRHGKREKKINGIWTIMEDQSLLKNDEEEDGHFDGVSAPDMISQTSYKSNYSPKAIESRPSIQVESLVNIESINMGDPNDIAAINDLKAVLSKALVDVVQEQDPTFHG